jgi:IS30 family transposase
MTMQKRRSDRCGRARLRSPGRPAAGQRENCQRFWASIAAGRSTEDAAIAAEVSPAVGGRWFRRAGGMPPFNFSHSSKPLSGRYLAFTEREEIAILWVQEHGIRAIARKLGRAPSTISRELRRNAATRSGGLEYRATTAQWHADRSLRRPKAAKLAGNDALHRYVQERLAGAVTAPDGVKIKGPMVPWRGGDRGPGSTSGGPRRGAPNRLPGACRSTFPLMISMRISHETIYQALYVQGRGALKSELTACLRTRRTLRMPRARVHGKGKSFVSPEIMISERPAEIADRAVPGHWEGDLILGLGSSAIGTLVERTTRFTILLHLPRMAAYSAQHGLRTAPRSPVMGRPRSATPSHASSPACPNKFGNPSPGIRGRRWRSTRTCGSPRDCRSTSAIRTVPGSAALTRIPTACCANTSTKGPISLHIALMTSRQ